MSTSQLEVRPLLASIHATVSTGTVPASIYQFDVHAIAMRTLRGVGDGSGGSLSLLSIVRGVSVWEATLIVVLFVLISGLVGIRLAETASNRDLESAILPLSAERTDESDENVSSPTTDHRPYEQYLSPETPSELLSDEGKVVRLLVENHGRIRQHQIADETGWSKSKVSRICSQMHADGRIEKQSVGRENVITLSDRQTDDVENPVP